MSWQVHTHNLERAIAEIGLIWPVEIRRTSHRKRRGRHMLVLRNGRLIHRITTEKRYISGIAASKTLWHELTHARQIEDYASGGDTPAECMRLAREWHDRENQLPYNVQPCEQEAKREAWNAHRLPLAISASDIVASITL